MLGCLGGFGVRRKGHSSATVDFKQASLIEFIFLSWDHVIHFSCLRPRGLPVAGSGDDLFVHVKRPNQGDIAVAKRTSPIGSEG